MHSRAGYSFSCGKCNTNFRFFGDGLGRDFVRKLRGSMLLLRVHLSNI